MSKLAIATKNDDPVEIVINAFGEFKEKHDKRLGGFEQKLEEIQQQADRLEEVQNRPGLGRSIGASATLQNRFAVTVSGKQIPVLAREDQLSNHFRAQPNYGEPEWSIGDFVKNSLGVGGRNNVVVERGTSTVPEELASQIIDAVRAKNILIKSGALTLPIEGKTRIAKIDTDPTAFLHAEGVGI
jgi:HK97 family phage major capsid protein